MAGVVGVSEAVNAPLSAAVGGCVAANSTGFLPAGLNGWILPGASLSPNSNAALRRAAVVGGDGTLAACKGGDNKFTASCARPAESDNERSLPAGVSAGAQDRC
ncbi:hypothetical protein FACS189481_1710 [Clostridia bacterium]|nr:hypothetical protein FACS189481_1710 [Clostridia bacterium]